MPASAPAPTAPKTAHVALLYHGMRLSNGAVSVTAGGRELDPAPSRRIRAYAPFTMFGWGAADGGSQLALALLLDATGDAELALAHHERFRLQHVAQWDEEVWTISRAEIVEWLDHGLTRHD